jgi:hypothetical protein
MVNKELNKMITNHQRTQTMNLILITLKMPTWLLLVLNSENLMANGLILMMSMSTHLFLNLELIQKLLKLPLLEVRDLSHGLSMILKDTDQLRSFLSLIQRLLRLTLLSILNLELIQRHHKLPQLEAKDLILGLNMTPKDMAQLKRPHSLILKLPRLTLLSMPKLSQHQIETQTGPHIA